MARIIAIDFGTKRVGIAVTDPMQMIATALTTVATHEALVYLKSYMLKEQVSDIVVGKPINLKGEPSQAAKAADNFVHLLQKTFQGMNVYRVDERFTSSLAQHTLLQMGLNRKNRAKKENLDQLSAVLILQTFLELKANNKI
jgi:putative Holliday junction resolvase